MIILFHHNIKKKVALATFSLQQTINADAISKEYLESDMDELMRQYEMQSVLITQNFLFLALFLFNC
jgi:hypothetical protein